MSKNKRETVILLISLLVTITIIITIAYLSRYFINIPAVTEVSIDPLTSEVGADYSQLQKLLTAQKWKEADQETLRIMLWIARREQYGYFTIQDIQQFPCTDLRTINQLWITKSNGRFGLSIQNHIWQEIQQNQRKYDKLALFVNEVGWFRDTKWVNAEALTYELIRAPLGHLPYQVIGNWRNLRDEQGKELIEDPFSPNYYLRYINDWVGQSFGRIQTCLSPSQSGNKAGQIRSGKVKLAINRSF